ncbi:hypothetical protein ACFYR2_26650 [Streptomyces microflavus]|uniref:hypothetical protein n=1 Tax=Streptomyces microflavus TaxID=1919 RepID=UPI0029B9B74C|nr:hypothetical protein [Streptomyces microflavus]MDX2406845.1 hypothetical protein [Streptomyces microflavus]
MSFEDRTGSTGADDGSWRRVALPVPRLSRLARGSDLISRPGTYIGSGLAAWVATGRTQGESTWATVILALAVIAADVLRTHRCSCARQRGRNR